MIDKKGWIEFNTEKYWTLIKQVPALDFEQDGPEHNGPHGGKRMGSTCADCHNPDDMSLRLTRPALVNALVARGYDKDTKQGVKASRQEMRTLVCAQCHVEYYFKPTGSKVKVKGEKIYDEFDSLRKGNELVDIEVPGIELVFPWSTWAKDKPFRIEMFDEHYDAVRNLPDGLAFKQD